MAADYYCLRRWKKTVVEIIFFNIQVETASDEYWLKHLFLGREEGMLMNTSDI